MEVYIVGNKKELKRVPFQKKKNTKNKGSVAYQSRYHLLMERGHSLRGETEEAILGMASGFSLLLVCGLGQISLFLQTSQL